VHQPAGDLALPRDDGNERGIKESGQLVEGGEMRRQL